MDYFRCTRCQLVQQSPIPQDVSSFYDAYPIHQQKGFLHRMMREVVMGPVYYRPKESLQDKIILDYGCGDGWFLEALARGNKGKGAQRVGYERDAAHAARLRENLGIPIYSDREALLRDYAGKVDVLTMHFVLEHVTDLDETFDTVSRLLRPGGLFYSVVPHLQSFEARIFGRKWHNLDPPRHISFPNVEVTHTLGQRHGMSGHSSRYLAFPNGFAGSVAAVLAGRFRFGLFLLFLPLGILFSRLFRRATLGVELVKA